VNHEVLPKAKILFISPRICSRVRYAEVRLFLYLSADSCCVSKFFFLYFSRTLICLLIDERAREENYNSALQCSSSKSLAHVVVNIVPNVCVQS
jgi:hypothetical protein